MPTFSLLNQLTELCLQEPDASAIIDARSKVISRKRLLYKVQTLARGFMAAGLQPGERVLFAVRPDAHAILLMLAIAEAGGVLVPLDPSMGPALFRSRMELLSPRWVVAESVLYLATSRRSIRHLLSLFGVRLPPLAKVKNAKHVRVGSAWPGIPASLSITAIERLGEKSMATTRDPVDHGAAIIVFTSGTTGAPKAVVHSRRSMRSVLDSIGSLLDAGRDDVIYARELHVVLPALNAGATVVVPGRSGFSAKQALRDFKKFQVTHFFGVSAELQQLVDHLHSSRQKLPDCLRGIWIGAAPVRASFLQALQGVLARNTKVWCVYGMTEILPVARISLAEKVEYQGKGDIVGACVPGVSAVISEDGELVLRGPNLFSGYFGELPCTEHFTGDLARLDEGRIVLLGRRKDMIIRGRFNIYPELYESTIERMPGVRRCAMVGIYNAALEDEQVVLAVEPAAGVDSSVLKLRVLKELRSGPFCIDSDALPDNILVMRLPMAGRSGKVDKQALREHAQRMST
jgi:acyl-CoA synthetase (AMP-forming)/AMP-acid ligase II